MQARHLFLLPLAACFLACTDTRTGSDTQAEAFWGQASLSVENPIAPGDTLCYQIDIKLDTLSGDGKLARGLAVVLRDSVLGAGRYATVQEAMKACADSIETEWKTELAEMYDPESDFNETLQYYYDIEGANVENAPDSILSYQTTIDCYLGGAHGSYVVMYYNFDKASGKLLNIRDVVPADKEQEVLEAMKKQLVEDWGAEDWADLQEQTGIGALGDLYLTNNFLLSKDSIVFLFNQYEIAPYAAGLIGVTVRKP